MTAPAREPSKGVHPLKFIGATIPLALLLLLVGAAHASSQQPALPQRPPIIDMHIHAFGWDHQGSPPPPNPLTGKVPPARTDIEAMEASLAELRRYQRGQGCRRWAAGACIALACRRPGTDHRRHDDASAGRRRPAGGFSCWAPRRHGRAGAAVLGRGPQRSSAGTVLGVGRGAGYSRRHPYRPGPPVHSGTRRCSRMCSFDTRSCAST
jgi:hypothetical protein